MTDPSVEQLWNQRFLTTTAKFYGEQDNTYSDHVEEFVSGRQDIGLVIGRQRAKRQATDRRRSYVAGKKQRTKLAIPL